MKTSLIQAEFRKLLCHRRLIGFFLFLLSLNLISSWLQATPQKNRQIAREQYSGYETNPARFNEYYEELEQMAIVTFRNGGQLPCTFSGDPDCDDLVVLNTIREQNSYYDRYTDLLQKHIDLANQRVRDLKSYGYSEKTYSSQAQLQTAARYTQLGRQVTFQREIPIGYDTYLSMGSVNWLTLLFLTLLIPTVYLQEHTAGFSAILRVSKNGRFQTGVAKILCCFAVTVLTVLCFSASSALAVGLRVGYSSLWNTIQAFPAYATVPFHCNVFQYLLLHTALRLVAFLLYASVLAAVASAKFPYFVSVITGAVAAGLPKLIFSLPQAGTVAAAHYLNPVALLENADLLGYYRTIQLIGKKPHSLLVTLVFLAATLSIVYFCIAVFLHGRRMQYSLSLRSLDVRLQKTISGLVRFRTIRKKTPNQSRLWFEFKKRKPLLTLLALVLIPVLYFYYVSGAIGSMEHYGEALYIRYINQVAPMDDAERTAYLESEHARIDALISVYDINQTAMENGEISPDAYFEYLERYQTARSEEVALARLEQYVHHLEQQELSTGIRGNLIYDKGYQLLFSPAPNWFLTVLLLFLCVPSFAVEFDCRGNGCYPIIRATRGGSGKLFRDKMFVYLSVTAMVAILFRMLDYFAIGNCYIFPDLNAPLISVQTLSGWKMPLSVLQYMLLDAIIHLLFFVALSALILSISAFFRNGIFTFGISTLLIAIPAVLINRFFQNGLNMGGVIAVKLLMMLLITILFLLSMRKFRNTIKSPTESI